IVNGRTYDSSLDSNTFDVDGYLNICFYGGVLFSNDTVKETGTVNYYVMSSAVNVPRQWREDGFPANAILYCDASNIYLNQGDTDLPNNVRDALWELARRPVARD